MQKEENEQAFLDHMLLQMLQNNAKALPLYISTNLNEKPPPLCGAIPPGPGYHAKTGDMVAALVTIESKPQWIVAEVIKCQGDKYEVKDVIPLPEDIERHKLHKQFIKPMPLWRANPETDPDSLYLPGTHVMAVYPRTTTFYEAVVRKLPLTHLDDYALSFKDHNGSYGAALPVPQGLIVPME